MMLDHMMEWSVPIGALAEDAGRILYIPRTLCGHCLSPEQLAVAQLVGDDLRETKTLDRVPDGCGPHIILGAMREMVDHWPTESWIRHAVLGEPEPISQALEARMKSLVGDTRVDPDDPIDGDVDI